MGQVINLNFLLLKVTVPLTNKGALRGWIFDLVCPGNAMSVSHERLLLLKNATVNSNLGFNDVCNEKHVFVAYNNLPGVFEVSINRTTKFLNVWTLLLCSKIGRGLYYTHTHKVHRLEQSAVLVVAVLILLGGVKHVAS